MGMRPTKGKGQKANLVSAGERLADETEEWHSESDGHVLVEDLSLISPKNVIRD